MRRRSTSRLAGPALLAAVAALAALSAPAAAQGSRHGPGHGGGHAGAHGPFGPGPGPFQARGHGAFPGAFPGALHGALGAPPPAGPYASFRGFGRDGAYLYGAGGVGHDGRVPLVVIARLRADQPPAYSYGGGYAYGHGYWPAVPDCGGRYGYRPCGGHADVRRGAGHGHRARHRDGAHGDRPPAYGRVDGGYAWIEHGRRDTGYGCDCPRTPLYD